MANQKGVKAHRFSYELANGPIPDGLFVCHKCDNPKCVRPDHLFLGTNQDNVTDMVRKGRHVPNAAGINVPRGNNHHWAILTEEQVHEIRKRYANERISYRELGEIYGVSGAAIGEIIRRANWSHVD
jgi:hypothetical protein